MQGLKLSTRLTAMLGSGPSLYHLQSPTVTLPYVAASLSANKRQQCMGALGRCGVSLPSMCPPPCSSSPSQRTSYRKGRIRTRKKKNRKGSWCSCSINNLNKICKNNLKLVCLFLQCVVLP